MTTQIIAVLCSILLISGCTDAQTDKAETIQSQESNLKLIVMVGFGDSSIVISENATPQIIKETMNSIDWEKFHLVLLDNEEDSTSLDVGGSLYEDGLSASFNTYDMNYIKEPYPRSVEEMTEILITYLQGKEALRKKYLFE
jgi:hypothetical protein